MDTKMVTAPFKELTTKSPAFTHEHFKYIFEIWGVTVGRDSLLGISQVMQDS